MDFKYKVDGRDKLEIDVIDEILTARGIKNISHFLNPTEADLLPATDLKYIQEAADIVMDALDEGKKFFVNLDSDLDGITSGTIIYKWLLWQITHSDLYRDKNADEVLMWSINEGKSHGMTNSIMEKMIQFQPDVVIVVDSLDSGTLNYKEIKRLTNAEIVVLDHHYINPDVNYDEVVTLVSSQREYGNKDLCGAGVVYKFVQFLNMMCSEPYDTGLAELAAAGTVGDMMSLDEEHMENRAIVSLGLKENLEYDTNYFIQGIVGDYAFNSKSFSFSVAPLINAANRMKENELAAKAMLFDMERDFEKDIKDLRKIKEQQNKLVDQAMNKVKTQIANQSWKNFIIANIDKDIAEISGLIGNKLVSEFNKPVLVLRENVSGYSGSGRAKGYESFKDICESTGLIKCAGHENAFGVLEIRYEDFDSFCDSLDEVLGTYPKQETIDDIDCLVEPSDINYRLCELTAKVDRISGYNFPALKYAVVLDNYGVTTMSKGKHLVFTLDNNSVVFIQWNSGDSAELYADHAMCGDRVLLCGSLDYGRIGKYDRRMIIEDIVVLDV